jgi:hypothetical protein
VIAVIPEAAQPLSGIFSVLGKTPDKTRGFSGVTCFPQSERSSIPPGPEPSAADVHVETPMSSSLGLTRRSSETVTAEGVVWVAGSKPREDD